MKVECCLLEQQMQRVADGENSIVKQNLVLVGCANNVNHDIGLELVEHNAVIVEDNITSLLARLINETLLKGLLRLGIGVWVRRRAACIHN